MKKVQIYADASDGCLTFDIRELFASISDESKREVAKTIALDMRIIEAVCGAVAADGNYFEWSDGTDGYLGFSTGEKSSLVEDARLKLLPLMPKITQEFIAELILQRGMMAWEADQWRSKCWELQQKWDDFDRPDRSVDYSGRPRKRPTPENIALELELFENEIRKERDAKTVRAETTD
jgi:hypothetical protein